ncbi:MAG: hypothetical protein RTU92_12895 [Candidatus Thorarchaeota archaeon]
MKLPLIEAVNDKSWRMTLSRGNHQAVTKKETLLTLRECVRSAPATMASLLRITRQAARLRIQSIENNDTVTGYIPIVKPDIFGEPVLLQIKINSSQKKKKLSVRATRAEGNSMLHSISRRVAVRLE